MCVRTFEKVTCRDKESMSVEEPLPFVILHTQELVIRMLAPGYFVGLNGEINKEKWVSFMHGIASVIRMLAPICVGV